MYNFPIVNYIQNLMFGKPKGAPPLSKGGGASSCMPNKMCVALQCKMFGAWRTLAATGIGEISVLCAQFQSRCAFPIMVK